jgi:sugar-specific transcriptional regulator TrmB
MHARFLIIREIFEELTQNFGINHAKVCDALLSDTVMSASQLVRVTGIERGTLYRTLRELRAAGFVEGTRTSPRMFYLSDLIERFDRLSARKMKILREKRIKLFKLMHEAHAQQGAFLLIVDKNNVRMLNFHTKMPVESCREARMIKQAVNRALRSTSDQPIKR